MVDPHIPTLILRRIAARPDATGGVLLFADPGGDLPLCVTLEDPWRNNRRGASCIPPGSYRVVPHHGRRFHDSFEVLVPGRSGIVFHAGTSAVDTDGCIILGTYFDPGPGGRLEVRESDLAFRAFMGMAHAREITHFTLLVENCWGEPWTARTVN